MIPNEDLAAWLAGEADPAVAERVEAAVAEDPDVADRVESIRRVDALLADLPPVVPDDAAVARITAAAQRAASDVLDLEAARSAEAAPGGRRGAADGTWLSTWGVRVAAATGVVALAAVGFSLERGGMISYRESDDAAVGSITAEGGEMAAREDVAGDDMAESMAQDGAAGGTDATEEAAPATAPMATSAPTDTAVADGEVELDAGTDMASVAGAIDAAAWDEVVAGLVPIRVTTAGGDVLAVDAGRRLDVFATDATDEGAQSDTTLYSVPRVMTTATVVQSWLDQVGSTARSAQGFEPGRDPSTPTVDDVVSCIDARSAVVDPADAAVVAVVVGLVGVDATPAIALVDEFGGIVVVDAATCVPLGP